MLNRIASPAIQKVGKLVFLNYRHFVKYSRGNASQPYSDMACSSRSIGNFSAERGYFMDLCSLWGLPEVQDRQGGQFRKESWRDEIGIACRDNMGRSSGRWYLSGQVGRVFSCWSYSSQYLWGRRDCLYLNCFIGWWEEFKNKVRYSWTFWEDKKCARFDWSQGFIRGRWSNSIPWYF